jgi:hypothetical protein
MTEPHLIHHPIARHKPPPEPECWYCCGRRAKDLGWLNRLLCKRPFRWLAHPIMSLRDEWKRWDDSRMSIAVNRMRKQMRLHYVPRDTSVKPAGYIEYPKDEP